MSIGELLVYGFVGDEWVLDDAIVSASAPSMSGFGSAFELSGNLLASRVTYLDADGRPVSLAIEMFRKIDSEWTYQDTVTNPAGSPRAEWIDEIALLPDGTLVVSDYQDSTLFAVAGIVRIFEPVDGEWVLKQELFPPDGQRYYGISLDADAGRIAVGHAAGFSDGEIGGVIGGRVDIFERGPDVWERTHAVAMKNPVYGDGLGSDIELDGDRLMALATQRAVAYPPPYDGAWVIFDFDDTTWRQTLEAPGPPWYLSRSAITIALDGDTALLADIGWSPTPDLIGIGSVFAYDVACLSCAPDLDADGTLTIFDFLTFLNLFEDGEAAADFDGDGELTIFDFLAYQTAFDAGCS